jgi:hypothetical protein
LDPNVSETSSNTSSEHVSDADGEKDARCEDEAGECDEDDDDDESGESVVDESRESENVASRKSDAYVGSGVEEVIVEIGARGESEGVGDDVEAGVSGSVATVEAGLSGSVENVEAGVSRSVEAVEAEASSGGVVVATSGEASKE